MGREPTAAAAAAVPAAAGEAAGRQAAPAGQPPAAASWSQANAAAAAPTPVFSSSAMAVTAVLPRMVPRIVCGRRNFQNASLNATIFCAGVGSSGLWQGGKQGEGRGRAGC